MFLVDLGKHQWFLGPFSPHWSDAKRWLLIWKMINTWCHEKGDIYSLVIICIALLSSQLPVDILFKWVPNQVCHLKFKRALKSSPTEAILKTGSISVTANNYCNITFCMKLSASKHYKSIQTWKQKLKIKQNTSVLFTVWYKY